MADISFSLADITSLTGKLKNVEPSLKLTPHEYKLLLAIFAAAAARTDLYNPAANNSSTLPLPEIFGAAPDAVGASDVTLGDLQNQLLNAYIPGNSFSESSKPPRIVQPPTP
jgi:hypothetical protein